MATVSALDRGSCRGIRCLNRFPFESTFPTVLCSQVLWKLKLTNHVITESKKGAMFSFLCTPLHGLVHHGCNIALNSQRKSLMPEGFPYFLVTRNLLVNDFSKIVHKSNLGSYKQHFFQCRKVNLEFSELGNEIFPDGVMIIQIILR